MALSIPRRTLWLTAIVAALAVLAPPPTPGQGTKELLIGTSGTFTTNSKGQEKAALKTLQEFIKDETGLDNRIMKQENWQTLADRLAKGDLQVGVFQGPEYAWAHAEHAGLHPLALAANVYKYPVLYTVARKDAGVGKFADLQGQTVALPTSGQETMRLFLDYEARKANAKSADGLVKKIKVDDSAEEALDEVFDKTAQAAVADRAGLESYKRRKPGRFAQLKDLGHSPPLPPPVVVYFDKKLDQATLQRLQDGLLRAHTKERGQTLLSLFGLTRFEGVPADFSKVVAESRKLFPPPENAK